MDGCIAGPREDISAYAPRIETVKIKPEKIGALIGPGGKIIKQICETTGAEIDIQDDGTVSIFAKNKETLGEVIKMVDGIVGDPEIGKIYRGSVMAVKDFGAFVEILPGKDGFVHISELADYRVPAVSDICKEGDKMSVKVIGIDARGRVRLSRKDALAELD